jgi:hypothetical protein
MKYSVNAFYKRTQATEGELTAFLELGACRNINESCGFEVVTHPKSERVLIIEQKYMFWIDYQDLILYEEERIKTSISTKKKL